MAKTEPLPTAEIGDFAVPRHVAIIMDGNGRWAAARGLPRGEGHRRGVEAVRRTVRAAGDLGIGFLTIFSFSAENWSRPPAEIRELMGLLRRFIRRDLADLHRRGVRVRVIGEREDLDPEIRRLLDEAEELTKHNSRLGLVVAFNYGARQEIARAARRMAAEGAAVRWRGGWAGGGGGCPPPSQPPISAAGPSTCFGVRPLLAYCGNGAHWWRETSSCRCCWRAVRRLRLPSSSSPPDMFFRRSS